jgi:hypothetical protein
LLTAADSRIAPNGVRARLGESLWDSFVAYAESKYRPGWDAAFDPPNGLLACCGPADEEASGCPRGFAVDLRRASAVDLLKGLHLDHEYDVSVVCAAWLRAMPARPSRWDDGVDAGVLCQLPFGASERAGAKACVRFRCGNGNGTALGAGGPRERKRIRLPYCHTALSHRWVAVRVEDLRNPLFLACGTTGATSWDGDRTACAMSRDAVCWANPGCTLAANAADSQGHDATRTT